MLPDAEPVGRRIPAALFVSALLVGLLATFVLFPGQGLVDNRADPYGFVQMGQDVAEGRGFAAHGSLLHRKSPLYPLLIGAVYAVVGQRPVAVQLLQCLMFAGLALLVFDIGRRLYNVRTGVLASIACIVHPVILRYVPDFHLETLLIFLFTLGLWGTVRLLERPTPLRAALTGAAFGLAALTKAVVMLYPVVFAILWWLWLRRLREPFPWRAAALLFAGLVVVIMPWTVRNYRVTGRFVPITTGMSDAFLRGYVFSRPEFALLRKPPYTDAEIECNDWFMRIARDAGAQWQEDDIETDRILNRKAKEVLLKDPLGFVRKFVTGLFTFWYQMTSLVNSLVAGVPALIAIIFAVLGWRRAIVEDRIVWPLIAPVLYLNILLAALLALGRYSAPVTPALVIVAAYGLEGLLLQPEEEVALVE